MPSTGRRILAIINYSRTFLVYLCVLCSAQKNLIKKDVARWNEIDKVSFGMFESIDWYLTYKKE